MSQPLLKGDNLVLLPVFRAPPPPSGGERPHPPPNRPSTDPASNTRGEFRWCSGGNPNAVLVRPLRSAPPSLLAAGMHDEETLQLLDTKLARLAAHPLLLSPPFSGGVAFGHQAFPPTAGGGGSCFLAVPRLLPLPRGARPAVVAHATEGRIVEGPWAAPPLTNEVPSSTSTAAPANTKLLFEDGSSPSGGRQRSPSSLSAPQERAFRVLLRQLSHLLRTGLLAQLQLTVDQYVALITPTEKERNAKRELFNAFADFLRSTLHDRIAISVAGSTACEVDARGSDLDVVLLTNWGAPLWVLQHIVQYLRITQVMNVGQNRQQWLLRNSRLQLVESARVPLLSLTTPKGLVCDISVNTLNSVRHTEYFKRVIGINPILRPLMRMLKYWVKVRRLPIMREGGLPGIVWMILAVYFGTCPLQAFVRIAQGSNNAPPTTGHVDLTIPTLNHTGVEFLDSCDEYVPLFSALFRFFRLCGSRSAMTRSISISSASCVKKPDAEVAARVASPQNHHGVWDEVMSVEDPAIVSEPLAGNKVHWSDSIPAPQLDVTPGFSGFQPGSATDLAAKISAATWIVYAFELKRGCLILSRLLTFIDDAFRKVAALPVHLSESSSSPSSDSPPAPGSFQQTAHEYIAQQFRSHLAFLFQETLSDRFIIPGCDERLRQLEEQFARKERRRGQTTTSTPNNVDAFSTRAGRPFCACCSTPRNDFAVVLLHGRIHLVRLTSICADWSSWWTREFLSRRDVRSTLHGVLHHLVRPEDYVPVVGEDPTLAPTLEAFYNERLPPTEWPLTAREPESIAREASGHTAFPSLLLPVRKSDDSSPVDLLFSPCNFVCRLRGWRASGHAATAHDALLADDVFFLDSGEVAYLDCLAQLAAEAPWWKFGEMPPTKLPSELERRLSADNHTTTSTTSSLTKLPGGNETGSEAGCAEFCFQPAVPSCPRCLVASEDLDQLGATAGYHVSKGVFQDTLHLQSTDTIRVSWSRWVDHVRQSASRHRRSDASSTEDPGGADSSSSSSSAGATEQIFAPELTRATALLTATIEGFQNQQRRNKAAFAPPPPSSVRVRRTMSVPDDLALASEGSSTAFSPPRVHSRTKGRDLDLYVPPSKRVATAERSSGEDEKQDWPQLPSKAKVESPPTTTTKPATKKRNSKSSRRNDDQQPSVTPAASAAGPMISGAGGNPSHKTEHRKAGGNISKGRRSKQHDPSEVGPPSGGLLSSSNRLLRTALRNSLGPPPASSNPASSH